MNHYSTQANTTVRTAIPQKKKKTAASQAAVLKTYFSAGLIYPSDRTPSQAQWAG